MLAPSIVAVRPASVLARRHRWRAAVLAAASVNLGLASGAAQAQLPSGYQPPPNSAHHPPRQVTHPAPDQPSMPTPPAGSAATYGAPTAHDAALIPPHVEGAPYPAQGGGGYCYVGPHPVDTRVEHGYTWDPTEGQHIRSYPPVDLRLFAYRDGCYYFTGDPRDFGYGGQTFAYYGAHPVLDLYGGGWCFMMGGHNHLWRPWSTYFTLIGPWSYWQGPYDPFFWSYWPYYSFYYRSYYPHYYAGGRFLRGGSGFRPAPPIRGVPASAWRGDTPGRDGAPFRGAPGSPIPGGPSRPAMEGPMRGGDQAAPPGMAHEGRRGFGSVHQPGTGSTPHQPGFGSVPGSGFGPGSGPGSRPSFAPGPDRSFAPGPDRSFAPGPDRSFAPGPDRSFAPGPDRSFAPGPDRSFAPGPDRSFAPGPDRSFAPGPGPSFSPGPRPSFSPQGGGGPSPGGGMRSPGFHGGGGPSPGGGMGSHGPHGGGRR